MVYAIVEILAFLLIAAILGAIIGWLLRGVRLRKQLEESWKRRVEEERSARMRSDEVLMQAHDKTDSLERELDASQTALAEAGRDASETKLILEQKQQESSALAKELESARQGQAETQKQLAVRETELAAVRAEAQSLRRQYADAQQTQEDSVADKDGLEIRLTASENDQRALQVLLTKRDDTIQQLQRELASERKQAARVSELEAELSASKARGDQLEQHPQQQTEEPKDMAPATEEQEDVAGLIAEIAQRTAEGANNPDDDLKKIRGIGPVLERQLKQMGITSFRQIARFSDQDIARVNSALGAFRGRIQRDDWPRGAKQLHIETYGSEP